MTFSERADTQYKEILARSQGGERALRERAWGEFLKRGLPGRRTEEWKYSSLATLTRTPWEISSPAGEFPYADFDVEFEDGWQGLTVALAAPGHVHHITKDTTLNLTHDAPAGRQLLPKLHRISVAEGVTLRVCEDFTGQGSEYWRSDFTQVLIARGARVEWLRIQDEDPGASHISNVQVRLHEGARLRWVQLNGGAAWSRSALRADVLGRGAEVHIDGLTFARGSQHADQRVEVRHMAGETISSQLFKGILKDRARGVLNGKIYIARDAQKVDSRQLNHNLLLSTGAEADTKPELEIYADDVKANHGASIGRLDESKIFYLMSRGIKRAEARRMLAEAFIADILMKIESSELRDFADQRVARWLPEFAEEMS